MSLGIVVYRGKSYELVKRVGQRDDLALIVGNSKSTSELYGEHGYDIGDVVKVLKTIDGGNIDAERLYDKFWQSIGYDDYCILEPIDDDDNDCSAQQLSAIKDLQKRVAALEEALKNELHAVYRDGYKQGRFDTEADKCARPQFTRDEIVKRAKNDIKKLKWETDLESKQSYGRYVEIEFVVNREKRTVVCLIRVAPSKTVVSRGIAKCAPDDCFNIHIGKAIALRRALRFNVPDEYLNAPQPTKVRKGDVVYLSSANSFVRVRDDWEVEALQRLVFERRCSKIIDDSRDGYDYGAPRQRTKKERDAA